MKLFKPAVQAQADRLRPLPPKCRLTLDIETVAKTARPTAEQSRNHTEFFQEISETVRKCIVGGESVPFGSAVNGFWTPTSDLDVCVKVPDRRVTMNYQTPDSRMESVSALKTLSLEISRKKNWHCSTSRLTAKVPILRVIKEISTGNFLSADISANNLLAVENSGLISSYVSANSALRPLGLAIKLWAASRGLNDRSKGTLSSFALICMTIHFLQKRKMLPDLQCMAVERGLPARWVGEADVRWCNVSNERDAQETLGDLLTDWFRYFSYEYSGGVISMTKRWKREGDPRAVTEIGNSFLWVENPFQPGIDVANVTETEKILLELKRAYGLCKNGEGLRSLCGL